MEIYHALKVESTDEVLMALLMQFEFESFEENEDHFIAYIHDKNLTADIKTEIEHILQPFGIPYFFEEIAPQNWNALWEASFQPVIVDDFCQVRADFHPASPGIKHDLIINPKMAFGTGHHATTHMMIEMMAGISFTDKQVFDFGCGTGILAILASQLGAFAIDAVDIEHESYRNTLENCQINHVSNVIAYEGDLDAVPYRQYDIILANINRNILLKYAVQLSDLLKNDGQLLFSGVLEDDKESVVSAYSGHHLYLDSELNRDGWVCGLLSQKSIISS